jgi:hypothetical protein
MLDRLILSAVMGITGYNGLFPDPPPPLTLKQKAKERSISAMCDRKQKSKYEQWVKLGASKWLRKLLQEKKDARV